MRSKFLVRPLVIRTAILFGLKGFRIGKTLLDWRVMNDKAGGAHWSYWVIGAVTLVFNLMGAMNFFMQMSADSVASFPESYRPIIEGRPAWATAAFFVAVVGGSLGCLLLMLRKSAAFYLFIASLIGVIVTMVHIHRVAGFGALEIWIGVLMQLVVSAFLVWYSKRADHKGWTS